MEDYISEFYTKINEFKGKILNDKNLTIEQKLNIYLQIGKIVKQHYLEIYKTK